MRVGFPGYRGMVGATLFERLEAENDFAAGFEPVPMSTSESLIGTESSEINGEARIVADAKDMDTLRGLDIILTCQGDDYTNEVYDDLRASGWQGVWIDASGVLRQRDSAMLVSDVINGQQMKTGLENGVKEFIGLNCSSNIFFMGTTGLFASGAVERVTFFTAQAVSGAGARPVIESLRQNNYLPPETAALLRNAPDEVNPLEAMREATRYLRSQGLPIEQFGAVIAANILAKIGEIKKNGQTTEEAKAEAEINKVLGNTSEQIISMDGYCNRIDSLRSHTIEARVELNRDIPLPEIERMISSAYPWVKFVPNEDQATLEQLNPVAVSETLDIAVGRVRKMTHGPKDLGIVVVGDQLLWGAAEPLRRTLKIVLEHLG